MKPESSEELWSTLVAFRNRVFDQMQDGLAELGLELSMPQSIVLFQIAERGPLTVSALQARVQRSQATTSHLVTQLEKRGLVERFDDPADARRTLLRLSRNGRKFTESIEKVRRAGFERVLGNLPPDVRRKLEEALVETLQALEKNP